MDDPRSDDALYDMLDKMDEDPLEEEQEDDTDISEDSEGPAPGSPSEVDDFANAGKPSECKWEACQQILPDVHSLAQHLKVDHYGTRKSKYVCEWRDCPRRGVAQPSRFALVSHMRSHTGEKPFYCTVPECDRNFVRSDALSKHMRTVHDAENLEAVQKEETDKQSPLVRYVKKYSPLKEDALFDNIDQQYPDDLKRMQVLRRRLAWAQEIKTQIELEAEQLEKERFALWVEKELLFDKLLEKSLAGTAYASKVLLVSKPEDVQSGVE